MKTFDFEPTTVPHTLKTRILKLWNPTACPLRRSIATQSRRKGGKGQGHLIFGFLYPRKILEEKTKGAHERMNYHP
jgi:hypothetical protein